MKMQGGYRFKITGKPHSILDDIPVPEKLVIDLELGGVTYVPVVSNDQDVAFGESLGEASVEGGKISLPSPAAGKVSLLTTPDSGQRIELQVTSSEPQPKRPALQPERAAADVIRNAMAESGIWPLIWSSRTGGMPSLDENDRPKAIVINCVLAEPFRARGKVVLQRSWQRIMQGIKFLPRLLEDYGTIEIVLTDTKDPVARMMYLDLAGKAWVHFLPVPTKYPIENPQVLQRTICSSSASHTAKDNIWVMDVQAAEAIGACLAEGLPLFQRVVAVGGDAHPSPRHLLVRVGTPVSQLASVPTKDAIVLRGGLLNGTPVDPSEAHVRYDDDAFFYLPEVAEREFLSFVRPAFDRRSALNCCAATLINGPDRRVANLLRGEPRPCVACGMCEKLCPANLLPQVLHRYLYGERIDEAEAMGLDLCTDCNLCTYVCPSKIELRKQFSEARQQLQEERQEALDAAADEDES